MRGRRETRNIQLSLLEVILTNLMMEEAVFECHETNFLIELFASRSLSSLFSVLDLLVQKIHDIFMGNFVWMVGVVFTESQDGMISDDRGRD